MAKIFQIVVIFSDFCSRGPSFASIVNLKFHYCLIIFDFIYIYIWCFNNETLPMFQSWVEFTMSSIGNILRVTGLL